MWTKEESAVRGKKAERKLDEKSHGKKLGCCISANTCENKDNGSPSTAPANDHWDITASGNHGRTSPWIYVITSVTWC